MGVAMSGSYGRLLEHAWTHTWRSTQALLGGSWSRRGRLYRPSLSTLGALEADPSIVPRGLEPLLAAPGASS
jgi:hypothetical protein